MVSSVHIDPSLTMLMAQTHRTNFIVCVSALTMTIVHFHFTEAVFPNHINQSTVLHNPFHHVSEFVSHRLSYYSAISEAGLRLVRHLT